VLILLFLVTVSSALGIEKLRSHKKTLQRGDCELPAPLDVPGACQPPDCANGVSGFASDSCAEGEICCPPDTTSGLTASASATPPSTPAADPVTTDDPAAHTAIWFHGKDSCSNLKAQAQYPGRSDVITPISTTDDGGATGNPTQRGQPCHNWQFNEDPWPRAMPATAQLTVSGYSMGRHGFYNFLRLHGENVQRAVLFDPSYDDGSYPAGEGRLQKGMEIVRAWLRGDSSRIFVFAYGGATISLGITPWKNFFLDENTDDIRQQVFVTHDTTVIHYDIPTHYKSCLFDNTCGGIATHDYNLQNYRT